MHLAVVIIREERKDRDLGRARSFCLVVALRRSLFALRKRALDLRQLTPTTLLKCLPFPSRPPQDQQAARPLGNLNLAFRIPHPSKGLHYQDLTPICCDLLWSPNPSSTATLQSKPSFAAHPLRSEDPQSLTIDLVTSQYIELELSLLPSTLVCLRGHWTHLKAPHT